MSDHTTTTIDLLRHGQTQADDILRGRIDIPLSPAGYQQMQQSIAKHLLPASPWQALISSPLSRCSQFARDFCEQHGSPLKIADEFIEMDFGDWDGRSFDDLKKEAPELFANIWRKPDSYHPPNGETFQVFNRRIKQAWQQLLTDYSGKHVLLIAHGGVIRALLGQVMEAPLTAMSRIEVPYACLSRIRVHQMEGESHWPQLVFHNTQHHQPE